MKIKKLMFSLLVSMSMIAALIPAASFAGSGGHDEYDITAISFVPSGQYIVERHCDWTDSYWWVPEPTFGDKLTVTYNDSTKDTYEYRMIYDEEGYQEDAFVNVKNQNDVLDADVFDYPTFDIDEEYAPVSAYKPGDVKTVSTNLVYNGMTTPVTISIKFWIWHNAEYDDVHDKYISVLDKIPATPSTCTESGNIEYYYCPTCKKFFGDADGQKELAKGDWLTPPSHKMVHYNTSGLLKNGTEYDQCSFCGVKANMKAAAGYSKSYAKSVKVSKGKGSMTVKWKKQSKKNQKKFNGYQIRYSKNADMSGAKISKAGKSAKSKKISKLSKKTRYYVQVRTFTKSNGSTFYSGWSGVKSVKTK